jgi:hypothetical protein
MTKFINTQIKKYIIYEINRNFKKIFLKIN